MRIVGGQHLANLAAALAGERDDAHLALRAALPMAIDGPVTVQKSQQDRDAEARDSEHKSIGASATGTASAGSAMRGGLKGGYGCSRNAGTSNAQRTSSNGICSSRYQFS